MALSPPSTTASSEATETTSVTSTGVATIASALPAPVTSTAPSTVAVATTSPVPVSTTDTRPSGRIAATCWPSSNAASLETGPSSVAIWIGDTGGSSGANEMPSSTDVSSAHTAPDPVPTSSCPVSES